MDLATSSPHLTQETQLRTRTEFEGETAGMGEEKATENEASTWVLFVGCWGTLWFCHMWTCHLGGLWEGRSPRFDHSTNVS